MLSEDSQFLKVYRFVSAPFSTHFYGFQLHFVFETCMVSCHQSILVPRSPFLKSLLASQECGVGVRNLTVFLAGVKPETMQRVIDYIYTGTCSLGTVKHIMEMIAVKKMLNLDIDIERKLYRTVLQQRCLKFFFMNAL